MRDEQKTKAQLVRELERLRAELKPYRQREQEKGATWKQAVFADNPFVRVLDEALPHGLAYVGMDLCFGFVSRGLEEFLGVSRKEMTGGSLASLLGEDVFDQLRPHIFQALTGRTGVSCEMSLALPDNETRHCRILLQPCRPRGVEGEVDGFFAVFIDDSRESSARRAARDSQRNAQALLDAVPDASFLMEADGGLLACNTAATMGLDMAPGKILGRNLYDILPSHEADLTREMVAEAGRGKRAVRFLNLFEGRIFDHSLCPILNEEGEVARLAVFQRDITDRKRAEEELKKAEREYRGIFEHAPVGIFKSSRDGRYVSINAFGAEMFGYDSPAEMIQAITDIGTQVYADPADRAKVLGKLRKDGRVRNFECGMKRKDGSVVSVSFHGKPIFGKDGGISFIEGFVTDITDRKRAEEELKSALHSTAREVEKRTVELLEANESLRREVEERTRVEEEVRKSKMLLERTFASLRDAVFIVDAVTTRVMDCNPAVTEMFGYRPEEVIGESTAHLHASPKSLDQFRGYLEYAVEKVGYLQLDDFTMRRKSGELFPTEHTVTPLVDEQGVRFAWVSIVKDTTYRKETEETLATRLRYEQASCGMLQGLAQRRRARGKPLPALWERCSKR